MRVEDEMISSTVNILSLGLMYVILDHYLLRDLTLS